jgi:DNA-binding response OmpR family regulator
MDKLLKILIVDDDEHVLSTLYDFLSYKNYNINSAADDLKDCLSRIYAQKNVTEFDKGKKKMTT